MSEKIEQTDDEILLEAYRKYTRILQLALDMACKAIPRESLRSFNTITEPATLIRLAREKIDGNEDDDEVIDDIWALDDEEEADSDDWDDDEEDFMGDDEDDE